jgi:RNA polymerase sigma factor (sigma-70 family)
LAREVIIHLIRPVHFLNPLEFKRCMAEYQQRVFSFTAHMLGDKAAAADVTQDVFIKLWEHRERMDQDRMIGWLLRVARNACIDAMRKRKVRRALSDSEDFSLDSLPSTGIGPDKEAAASLFRERLAAALDTLGEPHKSIVILREVQEYKYEEISEVLSLPLNTVKVYLHRARKALRQELTEVMRHDYA